MLENIYIRERSTVSQYPGLGEHFVNAIQPLSGITAAALQDQAIRAGHLFDLINRYVFHQHLNSLQSAQQRHLLDVGLFVGWHKPLVNWLCG